MIAGGVKPMMPTLTGTVTMLPSGPVAVIWRVMMVYGWNSGARVRTLYTLASTCGKAGPAHGVLHGRSRPGHPR